MVGNRLPCGVVVEGLGGDDGGAGGLLVAESVARCGRRDGVAVGQQEVEPGSGGRRADRGDRVRQRVIRVGAPAELVADIRPQEGRVGGRVQGEQIRRRQLLRQLRDRIRPAPDDAVVAEEPRPLREGGCRLLRDRHSHRRRSYGGQHAGHPEGRGQGRQGGVAPQGSGPAVALRPLRRVPADPETVRVDRAAAAHVPRRPRLPAQAVRCVEEQRRQGYGRTRVGEVPAHQASRAQRNPLKICRRIG